MTKVSDLELVKQLEKEMGVKLEKVPLERIGTEPLIAFAVDYNGQVQGLAICNGKLDHLPTLLPKFQRLEKLVLYSNQISDILSLKELKGLTTLVLYNNQISDISSLKELKGLTALNLYNNQISDILSLKVLKRLRWLSLSRNQISDISSLKELKELTTLSLYSNQISDISSLKGLEKLKKLLLMNNKISKLPAELIEKGLEIKWEQERIGEEGIYLAGNPLESPPVEIIKLGNEAIRQYFKSLEREKQALRHRPSDKIDKELFFICYSTRDEDFVLSLCNKLKEVGVEIWLDQWEIAPGDNWNKSIDEALSKCTRMLIILSPDAVNSDEVQCELYTFFNEKKPVFPIVYRSCKIPRRLNVIQHMNFTSSDLGNKNKIAELVKKITK